MYISITIINISGVNIPITSERFLYWLKGKLDNIVYNRQIKYKNLHILI